jgi:3-phosphoshikimate 1-carboxyvinyltransferase
MSRLRSRQNHIMQIIITPSSISGAIGAPASKSSMQRACAAALLRDGQTIIRNPGNAGDDLAAIQVIQALGAVITETGEDFLSIQSSGVKPITDTVNCGESGLGIRMFAPIAALSDKRITLTGEGSLPGRPMDFFDNVFPQLGVDIISNHGKLPLQIKGPLKPADITIDGSLSSQFLTGLLMAYAAAGASRVSIAVNGLKSKPYIDLTLGVMEHFGWTVENRDYQSFYFDKKNTPGSASGILEYRVEGDWSGGAFLVVAGAIAGHLRVTGLDMESAQADRAIMQALSACGAQVSIQDGIIDVGSPGTLNAFHFDATDCPDLFPPLVALAAYCTGTTVITGVNRLAHKESNRALTLQQEFGKMGVEITLDSDLMSVTPGNPVKGAVVHSHHDHRIAMACAVAALKASGQTIIDDAQAIGKSYPDFYRHLEALGAITKYSEAGVNVQ